MIAVAADLRLHSSDREHGLVAAMRASGIGIVRVAVPTDPDWVAVA